MPESFISKIERVVLSNLSTENFGVGELAREMGMSRSQVLRKAKTASGQSVRDLIRKVRLK